MKRNWDTIRDILTQLEEFSNEDGSFNLSRFPQDREAEISYHMELLIEAGLVNGQMLEEFGPEPEDFFVNRLTWQGYEFLDAIRNDTVWQKTKKSFLSQGISMTFDLVKSIASDIAASYLKATIGG
jgi:hypothetical protein